MFQNLYRNLRYDWPVHFILFFTNWLPDNVVVLRMRGALIKHFLGSCGANLRLGRNIVFYNPSSIHIGKDVYIAYGCWFMAGERITIGNEVLFGPYCVAASSNHTKLNNSFRYGKPLKSPITIGYGSWIAAHVTLTAGCSIGRGNLIAAGAVVNGIFPDNVIVAGIPAQIIKDNKDA
jgi:acetyltransferase-like isoleucine patch superfamily enzyme